jgi:hypothetical protein
MNKYVLMLSALALIAAAPAYYAFQAQADETSTTASGAAKPMPTAADEAAADEAEAAMDEVSDSEAGDSGTMPDAVSPSSGQSTSSDQMPDTQR